MLCFCRFLDVLSHFITVNSSSACYLAGLALNNGTVMVVNGKM
ncbi:hypothetical protein Pedsa_0981 [Pseudopedobacter saltans DSM 12145]|uniref:Uncharacterized protein n=1 Tax=Pseudopedobacter saltans (strain ATCC 51119 / DSM 12145 / JCM 21818 / CCUG 39354 / LMG 10337 / NBRC 100064 / NCIMB 13643) TaxID=762903 RepID=F0SAV7_PSESL|nr:hypothetical protein Pedsa_0981 [Pseudopedobacter saltans DSM 12145]